MRIQHQNTFFSQTIAGSGRKPMVLLKTTEIDYRDEYHVSLVEKCEYIPGVKLPKCLEWHNTYDRGTNSSRMQNRKNSNNTHDTREGSCQTRIHAGSVKGNPSYYIRVCKFLWVKCARICYFSCCVRVTYTLLILSVIRGSQDQSMESVRHVKVVPTCTGKQITDSSNFCEQKRHSLCRTPPTGTLQQTSLTAYVATRHAKVTQVPWNWAQPPPAPNSTTVHAYPYIL